MITKLEQWINAINLTIEKIDTIRPYTIDELKLEGTLFAIKHYLQERLNEELKRLGQAYNPFP